MIIATQGRPSAPASRRRPARASHVFFKLLAAAAAAAASPPGSAQQAGTADATLPRVVITATRSPQRVDDSLADVTLIDRRRLDEATGLSLAELLAREAGVQFDASGGPGTLTNLRLRGMESRSTLLLIDGVRYGAVGAGLAVWAPLPLAAIERIEIVRGPLSGLYGSDASGGAVHIITRRVAAEGQGASRAVDAGVGAGSNGQREANLALRLTEAGQELTVHAEHRQSDGFSATNERVPFGSHDPDRDGFRQSSAGLRWGAAIVPGLRLAAHAQGSESRLHYDDGPGVDTRSLLRTEVLGLDIDAEPRPGWRTTLSLGGSRDTNRIDASASPFTDLGDYGSAQRQAGLEQRIDTPLGRALLAAEHLVQTATKPGAPYDVGRRSLVGLTAGLNGQAGRHGWQANIRRDRNSQFGAQTNGALSYGVDVGERLRLAASWGRSYVLPSFDLLYYPGFSNPGLLPETTNHGELSLRLATGYGQWRLAAFDNRVRGFITTGTQPDNIPRARIKGLSLAGEAAALGWQLRGALDWLDPRNASAASPQFDKLLPRRSQRSAKLGAERALGAWRLGVEGAAFSARFDDRANTRRLGGYSTWDLRAVWQLAPRWELGLRVNNLADHRYETVYGYNQAGREGFLTLNYRDR